MNLDPPTPRLRFTGTDERVWWIAALAPDLRQSYREVHALTGHSEEVRLAYYDLHEELITNAFERCSEGDLVTARYHCEYILEEERLDIYHEACCHAILSTVPDYPAYHARSAYECFAESLVARLDGNDVTNTVLVMLCQAHWGLYGNAMRKQYDMMKGVARALQQEEAELRTREAKAAKIREKKRKAERAKKARKVKDATQLQTALSPTQKHSEHSDSDQSDNQPAEASLSPSSHIDTPVEDVQQEASTPDETDGEVSATANTPERLAQSPEAGSSLIALFASLSLGGQDDTESETSEQQFYSACESVTTESEILERQASTPTPGDTTETVPSEQQVDSPGDQSSSNETVRAIGCESPKSDSGERAEANFMSPKSKSVQGAELTMPGALLNILEDSSHPASEETDSPIMDWLKSHTAKATLVGKMLDGSHNDPNLTDTDVDDGIPLPNPSLSDLDENGQVRDPVLTAPHMTENKDVDDALPLPDPRLLDLNDNGANQDTMLTQPHTTEDCSKWSALPLDGALQCKPTGGVFSDNPRLSASNGTHHDDDRNTMPQKAELAEPASKSDDCQAMLPLQTHIPSTTYDEDDEEPSPLTEPDDDDDEENDAMYNPQFMKIAWDKVLGYNAQPSAAIVPGHENVGKERLFCQIVVFLRELRKCWQRQSCDDFMADFTCMNKAVFDERVNAVLELEKKRSAECEQQQAYQMGWDEIATAHDKDKELDAALDKLQRERIEDDRKDTAQKEEIANLHKGLHEENRNAAARNDKLDHLLITTLDNLRNDLDQNVEENLAHVNEAIQRLSTQAGIVLLTAETIQTGVAAGQDQTAQEQNKPVGLDEEGRKATAEGYELRSEDTEENRLLKSVDIEQAMVVGRSQPDGPLWKEFIVPGLSAEGVRKLEAAASTVLPKVRNSFRNKLFKEIPTGTKILDDLPHHAKVTLLKWHTGQQSASGLPLPTLSAVENKAMETLVIIMEKQVSEDFQNAVLGIHEAVAEPVLEEKLLTVQKKQKKNEPKTTAKKEDKDKALDAALGQLEHDMDEEDRNAITAQQRTETLAWGGRDPLNSLEGAVSRNMAKIGQLFNVPESHCGRLTVEQKEKVVTAYPTEITKARSKFRNNLFQSLPTGSTYLDGLPSELIGSFLKWDSYKMKGRQEEFESGLDEHARLGYHKLGELMDRALFENITATVLGPEGIDGILVEPVLEKNQKSNDKVMGKSWLIASSPADEKRAVAEPVLEENQNHPWLRFIRSGRLSAEEMHKVLGVAPTLFRKFRNDLLTGRPTGSRLHDELPASTKRAFLRGCNRDYETAGLSNIDFQELTTVMSKQVMKNAIAIVLGPELADDAVMVPAVKVLQENQNSGQQVAGKSKS